MGTVAVLATALAVSAAGTGYAMSQKGPDIQMPDAPPDAAAGEKSAQQAGQAARRKTLMALGANQGRSSTILTGGALGKLEAPAQAGKTLLGA